MERKVVAKCPVTGRTREQYVNLGKGSAIRAHGRPVRMIIGQPVGPSRLRAAS